MRREPNPWKPLMTPLGNLNNEQKPLENQILDPPGKVRQYPVQFKNGIAQFKTINVFLQTI